jgi:hypothetical protein
MILLKFEGVPVEDACILRYLALALEVDLRAELENPRVLHLRRLPLLGAEGIGWRRRRERVKSLERNHHDGSDYLTSPVAISGLAAQSCRAHPFSVSRFGTTDGNTATDNVATKNRLPESVT